VRSEEIAQLRLEGVSLAATIGSQYLLQDISFEALRGDRIAIIGASGAGKTSLLRVMNRLGEPTAGSIYLEDKEYRQIPVIQLRQQVTLVMQESKLLGMTVQEALQYPLVLRKMPRSQIQQRLDYWMEQLHIPADWLEKTELQLSVGQKQLVAIARALVIQPKIILLDEPTSALDAGKASHLMEVLIQLANSNQTTILMVNHQLEIAKQFCTRVLFLQAGQLIQNTPNSSQLDWDKLKANLIQTETKAAQEWI
jgi:D-methionine transport system ATP-binding protein